MIFNIRILLSCLFLFFILTNSYAQLATNNTWETYAESSDVAVGDLNGDGFDDLFVISSQHNHKVYFNDTKGQFTATEQKFTAQPADNIRLVDLDQDGDLDAWLTMLTFDDPFSSESVDYIYLNDGSGFFSEIIEVPDTNNSPVEIGFGDIDGDGDIDLIKRYFEGKIDLYENNGNLQFTRSNFDISGEGFALADYNSDNHLDIWVMEGDLKIYLNDGEGHFDESRTVVSSGTSAAVSLKIIVTDIDLDGDLDVQGFTHPNNVNQLPRFINNGDGIFEFKNTVSNEFAAIEGLLVEASGSPGLELWTFLANDYNSIIFQSDATYSLSPAASFSVDEKSRNALAKGDFDKDGNDDVVTVGDSGIVNVWMKKQQQFELSEQPHMNQYVGVYTEADFADFNLDGNVDAIVVNGSGVTLFTSDGRGHFERKRVAGNKRYYDVTAADFNGDGYVDFIATDRRFDNQLWINNKNNGFILSEQKFKGALNSWYTDSSDVDGDGDVDVAFIELLGELDVWINDGSGNFSRGQEIEGQFYRLRFEDLNADGIEELLTTSSDFTFYGSYQIFTNANGQFELKSNYEIDVHLPTMITLDWNNDGILDILNNTLVSDPNRSVLLVDKDLSINAEVIDLPVGLTLLAAEDINNDNQIDIYAKGQGGTHVLVNEGDNTFSINQLNDGYFAWRAYFIDVDNDGDQDAFLTNQYNNSKTLINTTIDNDYSGFWYNPNQSGHGLQVEKIFSRGEEQLFVSWYAYHNGDPIWLNGIGQLQDNQAVIDLRITSGGEFVQDFNADDVMINPWGTLVLDFSDINTVSLMWDGSSSGYSIGSMPMQRLTRISETGLDLSGIRNCHSGSWYNPEQSGHGVIMEIIGDVGEERMIMTWYTYLNGEQYWILAQGDINDRKATLSAKAFSGGVFPPDFNAADVQSSDWGEITFSLQDDTYAQLSWESVVPGFENGSLALSKLTSIDRYRCN